MNGQSLGLGVGDTINIGGTRGDGSAVARTFTVGASSTVQDLLDAINDSTSGFGTASRSATASLNGGQIAIADGTDGRLAARTVRFPSRGAAAARSASDRSAPATAAPWDAAAQLTAGADAQFRVDGQTLTRSTNSVTRRDLRRDAEPAERRAGNDRQPHRSRATPRAIESKINSYVTAYNAVQSFITANTANGSSTNTLSSTSAQTTIAGPLANDMSITSMGYSITTALIQSVTGLSGSYTAASQAGLMTDSNGVLSLNKTAFEAALQNNFSAVKNLFVTSGTTTGQRPQFRLRRHIREAVGLSVCGRTSRRRRPPRRVTGSSFTTYATTGIARHDVDRRHGAPERARPSRWRTATRSTRSCSG